MTELLFVEEDWLVSSFIISYLQYCCSVVRFYLYFYETALFCRFFLFSETLRNYFSQYGEVVDCVIMKDKTTNQSRGFGFVKFKDPNCVRTVLETKPHNLDGRNVSILTQRSRSLNHRSNLPPFCEGIVTKLILLFHHPALFKETYSFSLGCSSLQTLVQEAFSKTDICLLNKTYLFKVKLTKVAVKHEILWDGWKERSYPASLVLMMEAQKGIKFLLTIYLN